MEEVKKEQSLDSWQQDIINAAEAMKDINAKTNWDDDKKKEIRKIKLKRGNEI